LTDSAIPSLSTLSLHAALPISGGGPGRWRRTPSPSSTGADRGRARARSRTPSSSPRARQVPRARARRRRPRAALSFTHYAPPSPITLRSTHRLRQQHDAEHHGADDEGPLDQSEEEADERPDEEEGRDDGREDQQNSSHDLTVRDDLSQLQVRQGSIRDKSGSPLGG